jgi:hypothetical protein
MRRLVVSMTSLGVPHPPEAPGRDSLSREESGSSLGRDARATLLDPFVYRDTRWCANCGGPQMFIQCFECEAGRVGFCFGCNEERILPWSRVTEAA